MKNGRRVCAVLSLICLLAATACGCMGARSPDEYGYALVIGVDQGQHKPYYISMLLQRGSGGSEDAEQSACPLVGAECGDFFEAVELIESGLPFGLSLARTTAIVFGEAAARSGSLEQLLTASLGTLHIRYYANLIAVRGEAQQYLCGLQSELNPNIAKLQYNFIQYGEKTGYIPALTLAQFYDRAWNKAGDIVMPLGMLEKQGDEEEKDEQKDAQGQQSVPMQTPRPEQAEQAMPEKTGETAPLAEDILGAAEYMPGQTGRRGGLDSGMMGSALFRDATLVGYLNGLHTQLLLMATGEFQSGRVHLPDTNGRMVSVLLQRKEEPHTSLVLGDIPKAQFTLSMYASIGQPAWVADEDRQALTDSFSEYLSNNMRHVFYACRDIGCDAFELGKAAVSQFSGTAQWEAYDWKSAYAKTEADFTVKLYLDYNPTRSRLE